MQKKHAEGEPRGRQYHLLSGGSKFLCLKSTSTSTGMVTVTSGRLEFLPTGAWPNASTAWAKGGTLKLGNFELDGEEMPKGVYGGSASSASSKLSCFTGTGTISIGELGTLLIFR